MRTQRENRRLSFEPLEDRCLLAVYSVSSTANSGAGSLRDAITQANITQVADEIIFAPELSGATIELSGSQLSISNNLVIDATALPAGVTIDGNRSTRLFWIEPGPVSVQLRGLNMTGARAPGGEGAIVNYGTLIVEACRFVDNDDVAIWNGRNVTVSHSFFYRNTGLGEHASGLFNQGVAKIFDSTFAENSRANQFKSPVIEMISGSGRSLTIERSTIGGDEKPYDVDGQGSSIIDRVFFGTIGPSTPRIVIKNSIVFGNVDAPVQAEYSLLADVDPALVAGTGYLLNIDPQLGPLADNGGRTPTYAVLPTSPALNAGDPNFVPDSGQTDQRGGAYQRVAGQLDMGAYEAQATTTATPGDFNADGRVDAADYSVWRDHLGQSVAPFTAGDATGDGLVDQADYRTWRAHFGFVPIGGQLVVNSLGDRDDGNISNGVLTLREAINFYRTVTWARTITFDPTLSGGVIRVGTQGPGYYQIEKALTIDARSLPEGITIDARGVTIGLHINAFTVPTPNDFDVTLAGLTITNGVGAFGGGGAINSLTSGKLTVIDCQLLNSNSGQGGQAGAIYSKGDLEISDTFVDGAVARSNPTTGGSGSAIYAEGNVALLRSTVRNVGDATYKNVGVFAGSLVVGALRTVSLVDSEISATTGGGVIVQGHALLERSRIENTQGTGIFAPAISPNSNYFAGNVTLVDSIVRNNTSAFGYNFQGKRAGSGIVAGGDVTLTRSRVENNRVTNVSDVLGGGIMAWGHVNATDSFINGNYAEAGGGIYARGIDAQGTPLPTEIVVTLLRTQVNQNESQFGGAAIQSSGSVAVDASSLSENRVRRESRSSATDSVVMLEGSSLWTLTITDSLLEKNSAPGLDVRVTSSLGNIRLIRSQVLDNEMQGITATRVIDSTISRNAGGVLGAVEIIGSTINDNRSVGVSGGSNVRIQDSTIRGNSYSTTFFGAPAAGVRSTGTVVVERSLIAENHSTFTLDGAGLQAAGGIRASTVVLVDSTVRDNTVTGPGAQGGGVSAQTLQAYGSTISGNSALGNGARGGGVFASQRAVLRQSTLSGNRVDGALAQGGGLWTPNLDALHATIFGNNALGDETTGGGVYTDSVSRFVGSVAAGNTAAAAPDFRAVAVDPTETAPGVAYSLIQNTEGSPLATGGGGVGNLFGLDPLLGPLTDNGGRTLTHMPLPGSPLIDAGDPTITAVPFGLTTPFPPPINIAGTFDQRGEPYTRVVDGGSGTLRIDIGAVEVQAAPSLPALDAAFAGLPSDGLFEPADFDLLR